MIAKKLPGHPVHGTGRYGRLSICKMRTPECAIALVPAQRCSPVLTPAQGPTGVACIRALSIRPSDLAV